MHQPYFYWTLVRTGFADSDGLCADSGRLLCWRLRIRFALTSHLLQIVGLALASRTSQALQALQWLHVGLIFASQWLRRFCSFAWASHWLRNGSALAYHT
jgi:hypothetical protein